MDKYLIINADDFGMCRAANMAVADLFEKGGITSATIMTPCGWAKNAGVWAKNNPQYATGVHLTFTSEWGEYRWGPVAENNTSSLRDSEGFMHHESDQFEEAADLDEVEAEIRAQIERFKSFGVEPSHLDNHMGSLYGIEGGNFKQKVEGREDYKIDVQMANHAEAVSIVLDTLTSKENGVIASLSEISAVGHRVLHGGEKFSGSVIIDEKVIAAIEECCELGPLHNPHNLTGIRACEKTMPGVPQVAVFDTAFHQTMPEEAYMYGIPYEYSHFSVNSCL